MLSPSEVAWGQLNEGWRGFEEYSAEFGGNIEKTIDEQIQGVYSDIDTLKFFLIDYIDLLIEREGEEREELKDYLKRRTDRKIDRVNERIDRLGVKQDELYAEMEELFTETWRWVKDLLDVVEQRLKDSVDQVEEWTEDSLLALNVALEGIRSGLEGQIDREIRRVDADLSALGEEMEERVSDVEESIWRAMTRNLSKTNTDIVALQDEMKMMRTSMFDAAYFIKWFTEMLEKVF